MFAFLVSKPGKLNLGPTGLTLVDAQLEAILNTSLKYTEDAN